jgi:sugar lactone lactonase YvrE
VFFAEVVSNRLLQINSAGEVATVDETTAMTMGLVIGPDGLLYGCRNRDAQIIRYHNEGEVEVLLQGELSPLPNKPNQPGEFCNNLAINSAGGIWFTDPINRRVMYLGPDGSVKAVAEGFRPNGIVSNLTFGGPGYGWLYVTGRQGGYRLDMQTHGVEW